jgi:hypothetical protein
MTHTRIGLAFGTAVIGVTGLLGLAACGAGAATATPVAVVDAVPAEAQVLAAMGFDTGARPVADPVVDSSTAADPSALSAAPSAAPSASPKVGGKAGNRKGLGRRLLRKNTLHGEFVVKTKDGTKTVDVQRGTVTAIDDKTVSVKSTDGFTLTWTFGGPIRVLERRTTVQPSAVKVGIEIGLAGTRSGSTTTARLIVIQS